MKKIFLLNIFLLMFLNASKSHMPKYHIIQSSKLSHYKISYDVRMYLKNGKLPTKDEIKLVSQSLIGDLVIKGKYKRAFVSIYLPYMKVNEGAFSTAHHDKKLKVNIMQSSLWFHPKYKKFVK